MCGIIGFLGTSDTDGKATDYLLTGLSLLQNRGYDSVGITTITKDLMLATTKYASTNTHNSLDKLIEQINDTTNADLIGIGHTRWATHGGKTDANSHPHHDSKDRISLVHNGIIENFQELKNELLAKGYSFRSQTDTEVVAVLLGSFLDDGQTMDSAIKHVLRILTGTWAFVIMNRDFPNKLWITRNGSPLLLGMEENFVMIASEQIAFGQYIKKYIALNDHDVFEITSSGQTIQYSQNIQRYVVKLKQDIKVELTPTGFDHWLIKEICEQPSSIISAINNGGRIDTDTTVKLGGLDSCKSRLQDIDHLILLGCGTSYNAATWSLDTFKSLDIFDTVACYDGAEFSFKDIPKRGKTALILLSQSGETKDLHRCCQIAKDHDLITIGLVNVVDSLIARETDCGVYLKAGREVAVASTKSFTNQAVVLVLVAIWFSQEKGTSVEKRRKMIADLRSLPMNIQQVLDHFKRDICDSVLRLFSGQTSCFLLGKGRDEAVAKEGALKMKEITYIHAEGYSSSALKHGAFALIMDQLPIILLDTSDEFREKNQNVWQEVKARNATVLRITNRKNDRVNGSTELVIDKNDTFGSIIANVYVQLISYYLAMDKGINPDFPRNLAKVVTVE
jgi:glutamine---fructose-6-phosphate transaminase (isomerizing)